MKKLKCPKCKKTSGDDWSQCGQRCPMPMSPYYNKLPKYKVQIHAVAVASTVVGEIECNSFEEYVEKFNHFKENWDGSGAPFANASNEFDMGDAELESVKAEDLKYYKQKE